MTIHSFNGGLDHGTAAEAQQYKHEREGKEKEGKKKADWPRRGVLGPQAEGPCPPRKVGRPSPLQGWVDRGRPKRNW